MAIHGRYFRPKPAQLKGTPYDSLTEQRLHQGALSQAIHHPDPVQYTWPHEYTPDFEIEVGQNVYLVEVKGYFQDREDCSKYLHVRNALSTGEVLVFVFEKPNKPMHFQKARKDGTKMTHSEWADKNGFLWFTEESIVGLLNVIT